MKYFYTDPLAAAFMAREYGVKLLACGEPIDEADIFYEYNPTMKIELDEDLIYVHPDSMAIFEPKAGDAVEIDRFVNDRRREPERFKDYPYSPTFCKIINTGQWLEISSPGISYSDTMGGKFHIPFKIIQRDDKPFFTPEVEA